VVPNVVGMKSQVALDKLTEAGYDPTEYERRFDDKVPEGVVIRQTPEAGEETKPGRMVYLVVSGGKEMAVVPDLMGKSLRDAKMQLLKSNLTVGDINFGYSEIAPNGTIFQQAPSPGSKINTATKVNLIISQGPLYGRVPVPSLKGLTLSECIAHLNDNKLTLGQVTWETRPDGTPNTVIEQYPAAGDLIIEGSTVDVFVIREAPGGERDREH
jgi:eukaryotic-like serine/threonine-protein kinase